MPPPPQISTGPRQFQRTLAGRRMVGVLSEQSAPSPFAEGRLRHGHAGHSCHPPPSPPRRSSAPSTTARHRRGRCLDLSTRGAGPRRDGRLRPEGRRAGRAGRPATIHRQRASAAGWLVSDRPVTDSAHCSERPDGSTGAQRPAASHRFIANYCASGELFNDS